jgi:hypothetical protein
MLKLMALMRTGEMDPGLAKAILDGSRKLSAGLVFKDIIHHIQEENWSHQIEKALAARNHLIHAIPFTRWSQILNEAELQRFDAEVKPLIQDVQEGKDVILVWINGLTEVLLRQNPHFRTEEWNRILADGPTFTITETMLD